MDGKGVFSKDSVSRRREASFFQQEIRGGPLGGQGRSGHIFPRVKRAYNLYLEFAKVFGIKAKVLHFIAF